MQACFRIKHWMSSRLTIMDIVKSENSIDKSVLQALLLEVIK